MRTEEQITNNLHNETIGHETTGVGTIKMNTGMTNTPMNGILTLILTVIMMMKYMITCQAHLTGQGGIGLEDEKHGKMT